MEIVKKWNVVCEGNFIIYQDGEEQDELLMMEVPNVEVER
jgi:hypothetical protein